MAKRKYSPEQIINKLRAIELSIAQGDTVEQSCRKAAINVQTYYRWRSRYGGMTIAEAKENKRLREENKRLKHAVADLTLDNQVLKEAASGNLVSPERRRKCVDHVRAIFKVSERRACRVLGQSRRTQRYIPKPDPEEDNLTAEIRMLSLKHPRYGYKRITALLKRSGWKLNRKRVLRIWRREGLKVPIRKVKKSRRWLENGRSTRLNAERPNHVWAYDFA